MSACVAFMPGAEADLSDWDLWGPLVFTLALAIVLSIDVSQSERYSEQDIR